VTAASERDHQEAWYRDAIASGFFEREGFRRLVAWNLDHLRRSVPFTSDMRVLSLGCGLGDYDLAVARDVQHLVALDLSEVAVSEAKRRASRSGIENVEFLVANVQQLDLPPASFDAIYALGTLHHLNGDDRRWLLRRIAVWLRPDGWFYARDPNARSTLRSVAQRFWRDAAFQSPDEQPLVPWDLVNDARDAGLDRCRLDYTDVLLGPLPWISEISSRLFWTMVAAADRAWLAVPGLRTRASQFALVARRRA
jgi:ubiquinone/menaquinone biosynthesis C-methylase UbiE